MTMANEVIQRKERQEKAVTSEILGLINGAECMWLNKNIRTVQR